MTLQRTATCYLFDGEKFLLHFHKRHGKWLPPGGHLEERESPLEAARREVREEVGLEVEFLGGELPYAVIEHDTVDSIFLARAIGGELTDGKWCSMEEIKEMDLFEDSRELIQSMYSEWHGRFPKLEESVEKGVGVDVS